MPSHLSSVGFAVAGDAELFDLAQRVGPDAQAIDTSAGTYFRWADPSGAELWLQTSTDGEQFFGARPHLGGTGRVRVTLRERVLPSDEASTLDGALRGDAGEGGPVGPPQHPRRRPEPGDPRGLLGGQAVLGGEAARQVATAPADLRERIWEDLDPAELAASVSALVYESRQDDGKAPRTPASASLMSMTLPKSSPLWDCGTGTPSQVPSAK